MSVTIPAACLDAIGGLAETDAPILCRWPHADPRAVWPWVTSIHGNTVTGIDGALVVLPQSAPALLQVLARRVGIEIEPGEVPAFEFSKEAGKWVISGRDRTIMLEWIEPRARRDARPDDGRLLIIADVFVWLARLARACAVIDKEIDTSEADALKSTASKSPAVMKAIEVRFGLTAWEVGS